MDFGSGVSALVPTAILVAPQASFEGTPIEALSVDIVPEHWRPTGDDRSTRLAAVVLAWNVFQHFYPYFDVMEVDWETTLPRSLVAAAIDEGEVDFIDTLKRLVTDLRSRPGRTEKGHRCACREDSRLSTRLDPDDPLARNALPVQGNSVVPDRNRSTSRAASRPSLMARTTSDWPLRQSPAANTLELLVR